MAEQKLWLIQVLVTTDEEQVEGISDRVGEAICLPPDHDGPCSTPWTTLRVEVDDPEEPERSELRALAEYPDLGRDRTEVPDGGPSSQSAGVLMSGLSEVKARFDELRMPLLAPLRASTTLDGQVVSDLLALGRGLNSAIASFTIGDTDPEPTARCRWS